MEYFFPIFMCHAKGLPTATLFYLNSGAFNETNISAAQPEAQEFTRLP
jgi:hypothetical protein